MKHIFMVNPAAGARDSTELIKQTLNGLKSKVDYVIYRTTSSGDAIGFIRNTLKETSERYRFYACGGDGTLNEVVNGVIGFENAEVAVFPCGSGNDYVKYYGAAKDFLDINELVESSAYKVDALKIGEKYAVNAVHFGLDSYVLKTMMKVRRNKILGGKRAYTTGVAAGFLGGMKTLCSIKVDGKPSGKDKILLCTLANGKYVGGSYKSAPLSQNDDGLIEVCQVNPISRIGFLQLMNTYKRGEHIEDERFSKYLNYNRAKQVEVTAPKKIPVSVDGELIFSDNFKVEIVEKAINFVVPNKLAKQPAKV